MYKINPELPLVWRTPTSLQLGVDHPRVVLPKIYPAEERMLTALRAGIADVSVPAVAHECGLTPAETDALLSALAPALATPTQATGWRISIDGSGPFVDSLGLLLISTGHRVVRSSASVSGRCDLAIVVGEFALDPHRPGGWLSRDVPHLPVVFGDESVRIGPLLGGKIEGTAEAEKHPCEQCIELAHRDHDECWVAMVSQLVGTPAGSQTPLLIAEATSVIARWIQSPDTHPITSNTAVKLDGRDGTRAELTFALHPDCACQALPRNVSVLGSSRGQFLAAPRRGKAASSHA